MALISGGALVLSDTSGSFATSSWYPSAGVSLTGLFASYGAIYRHQLWVYVVVNKRAKATARLPLKVYERTDEGRNEDRDHPYAKLLRNPNPTHDPFFFWLWTSSTYDVQGEAIWLKVRGLDRKPKELWPVHPSLMEVKKLPVDARGEPVQYPTGNEKTATFYRWTGGAQNPGYLIPERDVVHFRTYNPDNTVRGMSALEPLRQTLLNEDAARRATQSFWKNGARPGVALQHPKNLSEAAQQRLRANWDALHGGTDNTGSTAVLEEGMTAQVIPIDLEEAQYIQTRKLNREEVCAAYDMPPPAVHILDRATFSNITENLKSVYRDTMAPHLGAFESAMEAQLRPDFGEGRYAEFVMDEVLRGAFEDRADAIQKAINSGQRTPNEARRLDNLPPLTGGDRLYINSTMVPLDTVTSRDAEGLTETQVRSLMGRIGAARNVKDIDRDRLCAGLNGMSGLVRQACDTAGSVDELKTLIKALA